MNPRRRVYLAIALVILGSFPGCQPTQPFFLLEDGDLSHYVGQSTALSDPDVETVSLEDASHAMAPLTISDPEHFQEWDLRLDQVVALALHNSKVVRNLGSVTPFGFSDGLSGRTASSSTIYDTAIIGSDPQGGTEAVLANFDAQVATSIFWRKNNRPQNTITAPILNQDRSQFDFSISKFTAYGATFSFRNQTIYDQIDPSSFVAGGRVANSDWFTSFEMEAVLPLLRGRGTQINRIPLMLSRINTDVSLATFEASVRNLVLDIENTYWDLHCAYRNLEATKIARDSALVTWKITYEKFRFGKEDAPAQAEAQSREQYYFFRSQVETAWRDLLNFENQLRWLMGIAPTDGRIIRPVDEPLHAKVEFVWNEVQAEALVRSAELRQQKWNIKRRELELISARNQLLPQLDLTSTYRWLGVGDDLIQANRRGLNFPADGSLAFDELTEGKFEEWQINVDFTPPRLGARRELSAIANARLGLVREKARLQDMELNTIHLLTSAVRNLDTNYGLAQTHFNRWAAAEKEVESVEALLTGQKVTLDLVLDAQRRRADAQIAYYRALCDYNKVLAEVHFRKGSLLDHNSIHLAEGPWPKKAYWDALERARERDASMYMNYGWTRPGVISRGPVASDSMETVPGSEMPVQPGQAQPGQAEEVLPGRPSGGSVSPIDPAPAPRMGPKGSASGQPRRRGEPAVIQVSGSRPLPADASGSGGLRGSGFHVPQRNE